MDRQFWWNSSRPGSYTIFGRMHLHSKLNYPTDWNGSRSPLRPHPTYWLRAHRCQRCGKPYALIKPYRFWPSQFINLLFLREPNPLSHYSCATKLTQSLVKAGIANWNYSFALELATIPNANLIMHVHARYYCCSMSDSQCKLQCCIREKGKREDEALFNICPKLFALEEWMRWWIQGDGAMQIRIVWSRIAERDERARRQSSAQFSMITLRKQQPVFGEEYKDWMSRVRAIDVLMSTSKNQSVAAPNEQSRTSDDARRMCADSSLISSPRLLTSLQERKPASTRNWARISQVQAVLLCSLFSLYLHTERLQSALHTRVYKTVFPYYANNPYWSTFVPTYTLAWACE